MGEQMTEGETTMSNKEKSLLDVAASSTNERALRGHQDREQILDLALAFIAGKVSLEQCKNALEGSGYKRGSAQTVMAQSLLTAAQHGIIKVSRVKRND